MPTIDLTPSRQDFTLTRGDTWSISFTFSAENGDPIDLTGSTWLSQIRPAGAGGRIDSNQPIFATWTIDSTAEADGIIVLTLDSSETEKADIEVTYWYDIQQTKDGKVATPVQGKITVVPDVTIEEVSP